MVDFYTQYISTSSPHRAKLSVHLQAQAKPKEPTLEEKKATAVAALKVILAEHKITPNDDQLTERLTNASSSESIATEVGTHISTDLKLDATLASTILDSARAALGVAHSGLPAEPQKLEEAKEGGAGQPVLITDVHAWKGGMLVSSGVRPVRELEEFVEVAEKL